MLLEVLSASAGKKIFESAVGDAYSAMSSVATIKIRQWNTEAKIGKLYTKLGTVRRVKTIWQVDKAVDLASFYCDSHIIVSNERKKIEQLGDFGFNDNILIEGIAGQGKSIFLRYLCAVVLAQGEYIPLFIELRKVSQSEKIVDRIFAELSNLGLTVDESLFSALAKSGKIILFLDAFDEIPESLKARSLSEIDDLTARYDNLQVLATSRPHNAISMSPTFTNVILDDLKEDEYKHVIHKLSRGDAWADALIEHIENRARHVQQLLCTPLMVTLLIITYKSHKQLPSTLSGFYDSLFYTMLQRHDGTKPGYTRERGCNLDDEQYRHAFEALCILSKENSEIVFSYNDLYELTKRALEQCGFDASPEKYLGDIIKITCLIVHDGDEYRFIHKTVQEYYAAEFVTRKPEAWVKKFYSRLSDEKRIRKWREELFFLEEIDAYRFGRYYMLPGLLKYIGLNEADLQSKPKRITKQQIGKYLAPYGLIFPKSGRGSVIVGIRSLAYQKFDFIERIFIKALFNLDYGQVLEAVRNGSIEFYEDKYAIDSIEIRTEDILSAGLMSSEFRKLTQDASNSIFNKAIKISQRLAADEKDDILSELF